jgi:hypothetical protein
MLGELSDKDAEFTLQRVQTQRHKSPLANERCDSLDDAPRIRDDLTDSADLAEYAGAILNAREQSKIRESPPQKLLPVQQRGLCSSRSPIFRFAIGFRAEEVFLGERQMRIYRP